MVYNRAHTEAFYGALAERERERFQRNAATRVSLTIHTHDLNRHIRPGDSVLDIGAGPGRFTVELARLGADVVVGDISSTQLELNTQKVSEAGFESHVRERVQCDIVDRSRFEDGTFDAVVAYGGPLSYTLDRVDEATGEILRLTKKGGRVLFSVMSRLGSLRQFFGRPRGWWMRMISKPSPTRGAPAYSMSAIAQPATAAACSWPRNDPRF